MIDCALPTVADLQAQLKRLQELERTRDYERREALLQEVRAIERRLNIVYHCDKCGEQVKLKGRIATT